MHQSTDAKSQQSIKGGDSRETVENQIYGHFGQESFAPEVDAADQQINKQLRSKE